MRGLFSQSLSLIDQIIAEIPQKPEETAEFGITPTIVSESKYDHTMSKMVPTLAVSSLATQRQEWFSEAVTLLTVVRIAVGSLLAFFFFVWQR